MEQSAMVDEEECGICLDALKQHPVALPCSHKFCSECLNSWRSKYGVQSGDKEANTKCPLCRKKIPPSKEMITQLKCLRSMKSDMDAEGDVFSESYSYVKSRIERLEREIGDGVEAIYYSEDNCVVLPTDIWKAARANDIQKVLDWLGSPPVDKQRLNARNADWMDFKLMFYAALNKNSNLISILLQFGADVDPVTADGTTPLAQVGCMPECYAQARLLLEWGAEIPDNEVWPKDVFIKGALLKGNSKLANLLNSEFGGRRCEIINLPKHPDLIGKTCVVEKYLPNKGRYKVVFEISGEVGLVGPENLARRDRTPDDCGYYITYENGRTTRHDFTSKEECQAFKKMLTEGINISENEGAEAEARAEEAAASLLAELDLGSSAADTGSRSMKKGKKRGKKKKKGRK